MEFKKLLLVFLSLGLSLTACNTPNTSTEEAKNSTEDTKPSTEEVVSSKDEESTEEEVKSSDESTDVESSSDTQEEVHVDFGSQLKLDLNSTKRIRQEVTVYNFVDGDTTHFNVKGIEGVDDGVLKARYLAIDTPESTMKVEEWGKTASLYTKSKLSTAKSIIIESDDTNWNKDSSGERYLLWVWYLPADSSDYRLLNLDIVQAGYSMAKNAASFEYGEYISKAYQQAIREKIGLFTDKTKNPEPDENYYYGDIKETSIAELRQTLNGKDIDATIDVGGQDVKLNGLKVAFSGVVTYIASNTAYAEMYDDENDVSYAMPIYMGFTTYELIQIGNELRFVGNLEYYEAGQSWQLSSLTYMAMKPDYKDNIKLLSENNIIIPRLIDYDYIQERKDLLVGTLVKMENLTIDKVYTTNNGGDSDGAMTLTCHDANGKTVSVRTAVLYHPDKSLVTKDDLPIGTNISVEGIFDKHGDEYQVRVFTLSKLTINE